MGTVLVVGSINVDVVVRVAELPRPGETVTGGTFTRHQGGKGANQAVAAARMGMPVRFVGAIGDDAMGIGARGGLAAEGIDVSGVSVSTDVATGVALIVVDADGQNQIAVASGANATMDAGRVRVALAAEGVDADVVLLNLEIGDEALVEAAAWAHARRARLIVNPAPAREIPAAVLDAQPILVANAGEAARLAGVEGDPRSAALALHHQTRAPVIVTLGSDGAMLVDDGSVERLTPSRVEAVDATGAGDTFCGVLAAGLARGDALWDAVRVAMAAAALSTTMIGAREGMPDRLAVERFLVGQGSSKTTRS